MLVACRVIDKQTASHDKQDFGEAGRLMYEFFWFDFADWYIEASKARLYSSDAAQQRTAQQVLVYVLERTLRLWHPFMPYISEQLWAALPHQGAALMMAPWPEVRFALSMATYSFAAIAMCFVYACGHAIRARLQNDSGQPGCHPARAGAMPALHNVHRQF